MIPRLYPYQAEAVEEIIAAYAAGYRNVVLDAPTGTGKTYIARVLLEYFGGSFAAASLTLQDQFAADFPEVPLIKGHDHYCPDKAKHTSTEIECPEGCTYWDSHSGAVVPVTRSLTGMVWHLVRDDDWDVHHPRLRAMCAYAVEKQIAIEDGRRNSNAWYAMREMSGPNAFGEQPLIVVDEADALDGVADSSYEKKVSIATLKEYGWTVPADIHGSREQVVEGLRVAVVEAAARSRRAVKSIEAMKALQHGLRHWPDDGVDPDDPESLEHDRLDEEITAAVLEIQQADEANRNIQAFAAVAADPMMVTHWDGSHMIVKAICPGTVLSEKFWPNAERRLLMSGSFCDPMAWVSWLGLDPEQTKVVTVASRFPKENRPTYIWRGGPQMSGRAFLDHDKLRQIASAVESYRNGRRTMVHVHSAPQAAALAAYLPDAITYGSGAPGDRDAAIAEYLRRPDGLLIGQSLRRGLDLKDDLCRVNIIAKLPFNQLDRVVRTRKRTESGYYDRAAVSEVVQALGRGVRHEADWCINYILDGSFRTGLERMLPTHVREAIVN